MMTNTRTYILEYAQCGSRVYGGRVVHLLPRSGIDSVVWCEYISSYSIQYSIPYIYTENVYLSTERRWCWKWTGQSGTRVSLAVGKTWRN